MSKIRHNISMHSILFPYNIYCTHTNFCEMKLSRMANFHNFHGFYFHRSSFNPALFQSFIATIFPCFWKKAMKEMTKGADLLLDVSCSLHDHFGYCTSLHQNFRRLKIFAHSFPSAKSTKVSSCKNLYTYGIFI